MSFRFIQLADPQFGMFSFFSQIPNDKRHALQTILKNAGFLPKEAELKFPDKDLGLEPETALLTSAVSEANRLKPEFIAICGDIVNNLGDDGQWDAVRRTIEKLDPDIKLYWTPGNHDVSEDGLSPTADGLAKYRELFGDDYYTFNHQDTFFLVLNSETLTVPDLAPDEVGRQWEFMADSLVSEKAKTAGQVVVFTHRPVFRTDPQSDQKEVFPKKDRLRLLSLLKGLGPVSVFSGHLHQNIYARSGNVNQVISGSIGFPLVGKSGYRLVCVEPPGGLRHSFHPIDPG